MPLSLETMKQDIASYGVVLSDTLRDMDDSASRKILYNIDFCILYPYLWRECPPSVPKFKPYGRWVFAMLAEVVRTSPSFSLVFTGASYWELLDSIYHQVKTLERQAFSIKSRHGEALDKARRPNFKDLYGTLIESGVARDELQLVTKKGYAQRITQPVQNVVGLFEEGQPVLQGLGDFVTASTSMAEQYRDTFDNLLDRMFQERSLTDSRPPDSKRFHYKVDTANILASMAINQSEDSIRVLLATDISVRRLCARQDSRNPLVPYSWISALILEKRGYARSARAFLEKMALRASELSRELEITSNLDDLHGSEKRDLADFFEAYVGPLFIARPEDPAPTDDVDDEFTEIIRDPKKFKAKLEQARAELVDGAQRIAKLKPFSSDA